MTRIITDCRLGGVERFILAKDDSFLMNVPSEILECTAFVGAKIAGEPKWLGTAFLVGYEEDGVNFAYWVTAKHVLRGAANLSGRDDDFIYLRVNKVGGGVLELATKDEDWSRHPTDEAADVAVIRLPRNDTVAAKYYPLTSAAVKSAMQREVMGIGDEVFMVGLFPSHVADEKNSPIIRIGNIASMPECPVITPFGDIKAYLVELRSIGGHSGSPVFVHLPPGRQDGAGGMKLTFSSVYYLLGVLHGHFKVPKVMIDMFATYGADDSEKVYSGIGVVTPVERVIETIQQESLKLSRTEFLAGCRGAVVTTMDTDDTDAREP